jgi:hypothetical protein
MLSTQPWTLTENFKYQFMSQEKEFLKCKVKPSLGIYYNKGPHKVEGSIGLNLVKSPLTAKGFCREGFMEFQELFRFLIFNFFLSFLLARV